MVRVKLQQFGRDLLKSSSLAYLADELEQVVQDHVRSGFENLQGYRLDSLSEQPLQVFEHAHSSKVFFLCSDGI